MLQVSYSERELPGITLHVFEKLNLYICITPGRSLSHLFATVEIVINKLNDVQGTVVYDTQQQIHTQKVQKEKTAEILTERGNVLCRSYQIKL